MGEDIYKKIWELTPFVRSSEAYYELVKLTKELIEIYDSQGRLSENPLSPAKKRELSLPIKKINEELKNGICLVTGGYGLVGSTLVNELVKFEVNKIIALDTKGSSNYPVKNDPRIIHIQCDVRDYDLMKNIFNEYNPNFVFHTAAERNPALAEKNVLRAVTTNIIGTLNVIKLCERTTSLRQCVFSSTGKASRYYTKEIYAATKKVCEYIFDNYARDSGKKYSFVRFTHILENSLMDIELRDYSKTAPCVDIHAPGKYVTAQNVKEAAFLMLNALICSKKRQCVFLLVKNLEWPVESLEMALYYIKESKRDIPVLFVGNPLGYTEKFFRGQLDWSDPQDLNLLINVYENKWRTFNEGRDIIISHLCPTDNIVLEKFLSRIQDATTDETAKIILHEGLKEIVANSLEKVNKQETVNILSWGLQPGFLENDKTKVTDFEYLVPLLMHSLKGTEYYKQVAELATDELVNK